MAYQFSCGAHVAVGHVCLAGVLDHDDSLPPGFLPCGRKPAPSVPGVRNGTKEKHVNIGILGTGNLAVTLGAAWSAAGHSLLVTGRSPENARRAAGRIRLAAEALEPREMPGRADAVVIAVSWDGLEAALALVGAAGGALRGKTVIDRTNPVAYATGNLIPESGSAAEFVARRAPGAHVVKALHLFAGASAPPRRRRARPGPRAPRSPGPPRPAFPRGPARPGSSASRRWRAPACPRGGCGRAPGSASPRRRPGSAARSRRSGAPPWPAAPFSGRSIVSSRCSWAHSRTGPG